ncbi:hypothetical protein E3N88_16285 [Mikania micrantha]|uniref:Uncharacterized protein n=1 Tax=Mikania micrantha TaxID=192012 RepID=A0A5N6P133_9ASTR|nr:hypothetical protein E3N88_16285 [Mikania micrantha]
MWQVLLAAAIAGSGYFAKNLLYKDHTKPTNFSYQKPDLLTETSSSHFKNAEADTSKTDEEASSIFRFSSSSNGSKNLRKKLGRNGGIKNNRVNQERKFDVVVDDHKKNVKKFAVCLKKRRICRNASSKCHSFDVKDKSSFGYGVGVGIMCMVSAGKAEIERLNKAVDETAKVVHELKTEISKRKLLCDSKIEKTVNIKQDQSIFVKSDMGSDDNEAYGFPVTDEGEYASSILTEEPHRDVVEMEQLEAELESELLKLQVTYTSSSQNKTSTEALSKKQDFDLEFKQCNGVMPYELDQKLCHLLIEQQESQIVDLESELQQTNSKLLEKESELQALKDCVKRLSDVSITYPSGILLTFGVKLLASWNLRVGIEIEDL